MTNKPVNFGNPVLRSASREEIGKFDVSAESVRPANEKTVVLPIKDEIALGGFIFRYEGREKAKTLISIHQDAYSEEYRGQDFEIEDNPKKFETGIQKEIATPIGNIRIRVNSANTWQAECNIEIERL